MESNQDFEFAALESVLTFCGFSDLGTRAPRFISMRAGLILVTLSTVFPVFAQEPTKLDRPVDRASISAITKEFLDAFNAGDAKKLAATFTVDGQIIDENGEVICGRAAIEEDFRQAFQLPAKAKLEIESGTTWFLTSDVAVEEGLSRLTPAPGEPPEVTHYTVNYVKTDGKWLHAFVRDHAVEQVAAHNEHLKALDWMVGEWVSEGTNAIVKTKCEWIDDGRFLMRTYQVELAGKPMLKGTERVGWDPLTKRIRSWVFDNGGGFGEATWAQSDPSTWTLHASGVSNTGIPATMTRVVTKLDAHRSLWIQRDGVVNGKSVDSLGEYVMVKAPPTAKRP